MFHNKMLDEVLGIAKQEINVYIMPDKKHYAFANAGIISDGFTTWQQAEIAALKAVIDGIIKTIESELGLFENIVISHPSNYNIAIREDGKEFRIPKYLDYGEKIPEDKFCIQYSDKPCAFRNKYFDVNGHLRAQYWCLKRIL